MITTPIVQFGTSRFLQAHVDLFVSEAIDEGTAIGAITVIQSSGDPSRAARLAALSSANGYPVVIRGLQDGLVVDREVRVNSIIRTFSTATDWQEIQRICVEEAEVILSNTADTGYNVADADRGKSFDQAMSYPAKLFHLLLARYHANARPIQIMPMELIVENGAVLRRRVLQLAQQNECEEAVLRYLSDDVIWVNSLVDRIVSEPIEPAGAVAEPYALWAVEQQQGLVLPCVHDAIRVVETLDDIEALKLFVLNLGHTYLVDRWQQTGASEQYVREIMQNDEFLTDLKSLYEKEVLPAFVSAGLESDAIEYFRITQDRFANPFLDHRLSDIAQNHNEKIQRRISAFLVWALENNDMNPKPRLQKIVQRQS